jgi:CHAD domain-containing protein
MRVATRRLRAVLEIFRPCFPRGEIKAALRQVKALGDALGERRDRDVAIAGLEEIAGLMALPDRTGVETLTERLRAEQHEANEKLARFISPDRLSAIVDQLSELVAGLDRGPAHQGSSVAVELSRVELSDGVAVTTAEGRA